jgi:hypothetical protein
LETVTAYFKQGDSYAPYEVEIAITHLAKATARGDGQALDLQPRDRRILAWL